MKSKFVIMHLGILTLSLLSCAKLVEIPNPATTLTDTEVFADSADAAAAVSGIYSNISYKSSDVSFCNGSQTIFLGLSSDELVPFLSGFYDIYFNNIQSNNSIISSYFWNQAYPLIYQTNACIQNIDHSAVLSNTVRNQLTGESKFLRALFYFYLVNVYGDLPYIEKTFWKQTDSISRSNSTVIYQHIIEDLKDAKLLLRIDYSFSGGQRTRANKLAASALLARVYLYNKEYKNAFLEADSVIKNGQCELSVNLNDVFAPNSNESILQWQLNTSFPNFNGTAEGHKINPLFSFFPAFYSLSDQLLSAFDSADQRKVNWINYTTFNGKTYFYPYKYKIGSAKEKPNSSPSEYYTVLRIAEQYLIRAETECEGEGNGIDGAISDINMIRNRAGLANTSAISLPDVKTALLHERQIEFFAEWGHRWLDLKRTDRIDSVMTTVTPLKHPGGTWQTYQKLYPIPSYDITVNPYLRQNVGY